MQFKPTQPVFLTASVRSEGEDGIALDVEFARPVNGELVVVSAQEWSDYDPAHETHYTSVQAMLDAGLYDDKGALKDGLLDPDCIEAREWNLSAGQYKPFDFTQLKSDKSVAQLIGALKTTEQDIIQGLDKLLAMVEGRK